MGENVFDCLYIKDEKRRLYFVERKNGDGGVRKCGGSGFIFRGKENGRRDCLYNKDIMKRMFLDVCI